MKILKKIRNYLLYCGIEKEEYDAVKKAAHASNFEVWRILNCLLTVAFAILFTYSLFVDIFKSNTIFYFIILIYSLFTTIVFFVLKKNSKLAQCLIYLTITMLFLFGCLITQNKPGVPATMFIVLLLITPMSVINKPYIMGIELIVMSAVFSIWMYFVKPFAIWQMDFINVIIYTIVGFFVHIISNSIRIKEFVLNRKINKQKDTDDLTGLKNKGALTRSINKFLMDNTKTKGIMLILDIDNFKIVNDTFGHDVGDKVIYQVGDFLLRQFSKNEVMGRFGGDEFIIFIKDTDDVDFAGEVAHKIIDGISNGIALPDESQKISVSIGVAIYHGEEKNYSELFKKADIALYKTKAGHAGGYNICR